MNTEQISHYVMRYLEATQCHVVEKTPVYVTVKLSEQADRILTNRPYYWGFVDRTGAESETMRFTFVFDPSRMPPERGPVSYVTAPAPQASPTEQPAAAQSESIMQRYFGVAPAFTGGGGGIGRIPKEQVNFGSRRLDQIMQAARAEGQFAYLFDQEAGQQQAPQIRGTQRSVAYEPWLLLNLKIEFACDLKREEIHSFGVSTISGQVQQQFMERLQGRSLTAKLPSHIHTMTWRYTLEQAVQLAEQALLIQIEPYEMDWAIDASERLEAELECLAAYYEPLIKQAAQEKQAQVTKSPDETDASDSNLPSIQEQYEMRQNEIRWQFEPRISVSFINAAIVHLPFGESYPLVR